MRYPAQVSPSLERLASRLSPTDRVRPPDDDKRRAAVAVVLADDTPGPRVLLMKRAARDGDPWSGHISLPGGGFARHDVDLRATAIRETREELGIELADARVLGPLTPLAPRAAGPNGLEVTPFVFVAPPVIELALGPEAVAAFWLPLALAASGELDGTHTYPSTAQLTFPCWTYEGHVIWGLTRRIVEDVLALIG